MKKDEMLVEDLENKKKKIGLFLAPTLAVLTYILPLSIKSDAKIILSIMVFCIVFWLLEVLPLGITAFLGVSLAVVFGIVSAKKAFLSMGHPVILLFIGSFLIAQAMTKYGLDERIALNLLSKDIFLKSPFRILFAFTLISFFLSILFAFTLISFFLSMWISNTATTAMLLPLALGIITLFSHNKIKNSKAFGIFLLISIAYTASIGGTATLIGTPTNLVGVGFLEETGYNVDFLQWFLIVSPISISMYIVLLLYMKFNIKNFKFDFHQVKQIISSEKNKLKPLSKGEKNTILAFSFAVVFWLLPGIANLVGNKTAYLFLKSHFSEGIVAILAAILLFLLPTENSKSTLNSEDLKQIDWDTVLLFAGGIALGKIIIQTGLAKYIGTQIASLVPSNMTILFIFVIILAMIFLTEISSNTATAITFVPIIIGALQQLNIDVFFPVIAVIVASSFAFMLPIATPPNAIVFGSGLIKISKMVKLGFFLNIIGSIILTIFVIIHL
ncbi:SLC13 family permease [Hydrogenothermus marinus]|uniref:Sodium-dependent dicarboxylate transporter 2/3/5 n=1 Tax=Hydrogenothermus marinus TaxID=133270 RepID=A0A3M0BK12_9AQUI|nr:SLC13 family permease [Hydrogenothermus marinus]RMA97783.1 sodium-dependent dicarboxylate transporter 2/3/5 [Hydrogenothermus marinus]